MKRSQTGGHCKASIRKFQKKFHEQMSLVIRYVTIHPVVQGIHDKVQQPPYHNTCKRKNNLENYYKNKSDQNNTQSIAYKTSTISKCKKKQEEKKKSFASKKTILTMPVKKINYHYDE